MMDKARAAGAKRNYGEAEAILTRITAETDGVPEAWLYLGRARHASGDPERAVTAFKSYLSRAPKDGTGWFHLGRSYLSIGLAREAQRCFKRAIESGRGGAEAWAMLGMAELRLRRPAHAVECLEKAVGLSPGDERILHGYLNALYIHAIRLLGRDEFDLARQMLDFVIDNGTDGPSIRIHRAKAFRAAGRFDEAIADLREALKMAPGDGSIALQAAALCFATGKPDEALRLIQETGTELPGLADASWTEDILDRWRAAISLSQGDAHGALETALGRIKRGDRDAAVRAIAAQANYELGRFEKAANHYGLACKADPASADLQMGLALSLWELGDCSGARKAAKAAASRGANPADSEFIAVLCDAREGEPASALLPRVQKLLKARPGDPRLMFILGECQYKLGMPGLADRWFEDLLEIQPQNEMALLYRISAAESLKLGDEILERYRAYLGAFPDNLALRRDFVSVLMEKGKWDDSVRTIEDGYAYGAADRSAEGLLALCYRNAGRYREAAAQYRALLKREPRNAELLLGLAFSLDRSGASALAADLLERGATYIGNNPEPYLALGVLRARANLPEQAAAAFGRASDLAPADPRPLRNLARLYERGGVPDLAVRFREQAERLEHPGAM